MNSISLDAVAALTGMGRSTLWRKAADGVLAKGDKDARGRATLALSDVLGLICDSTGVPFSDDDVAVLLQADAGDAEAQADIGALLYVHAPGGGSRGRALLAAGGRRAGQRRGHAVAGHGPCGRWHRARRATGGDVDRQGGGAGAPDCQAAVGGAAAGRETNELSASGAFGRELNFSPPHG